ncbi:hypothetical protein As57867_006488, partial [Aphanomyces stellatus]
CLTENAIRILFIEKYATAASVNPVEGPILYLKKLHEFVSNVIECNPGKVGNYPTLWRHFTSQLGVQYWSTAPFTVGKDNLVALPRCTSSLASGWDSYYINGRFTCAEVTTLYGNVYFIDATNPFYMVENIFSSNQAAAVFQYVGGPISPTNALIQQCEGLAEESPLPFSNPATLRGLLDGVRTWDAASNNAVRPRLLAEVFAQFQGTLKQPILEGNGILYYCAFYACRANNGGDTTACFPEVTNDDWALPNYQVDTWNELTDDIEACLDEEWITPFDIEEIASRLTKHLSFRSHICEAE